MVKSYIKTYRDAKKLICHISGIKDWNGPLSEPERYREAINISRIEGNHSKLVNLIKEDRSGVLGNESRSLEKLYLPEFIVVLKCHFV